MTYETCFSFSSLLDAHQKCRRSKQHKRETIEYEILIGNHLQRLSTALLDHSYEIRHYRSFYVHEPKKRLIEALPYQHRIVQMALCSNILGPEIERKLIYDNAACRTGKGTHFALHRLELFLRKYYAQNGNQGYYLKCDIRKYFQNINQAILHQKLQSCQFDQSTKEILQKIIGSYHPETGIGIPIGNQTSQWFALYYLDSVDRLIKEKLKIKFYIRYMDDFLLIHPDRSYLQYCLSEIQKEISRLKIELNEKTQIIPLSQGIDFLGFHHRLSNTGKVYRKLRQKAKARLRGNFKRLEFLRKQQLINDAYIKNRLNCFYAHLINGNCFKLNLSLLQTYPELNRIFHS